MFLGQVVLNALHFGAAAGPAFDGQTGCLQLLVQLPPRRIHHGCIFQRSLALLLQTLQPLGFPFGAFLLLAGVVSRIPAGVLPGALSSFRVLGNEFLQRTSIFAAVAPMARHR